MGKTFNPETHLQFATAPKRNSVIWKNGRITWSEFCEKANDPQDHKEAGNYIFGYLDGDRRNKSTIAARSAVTLDVDYPQEDFLSRITNIFGDTEFLLHTTFSSKPEARRYRLIFPLEVPVAPDLYRSLCEGIMDAVGRDNFDPSTSQPERYMFMPAAEDRESYYVQHNVGKALNPSAPMFSSTGAPSPSRESRNWKKDPTTLKGIPGKFCQAYPDWAELISIYDLPYTQVSANRFHLNGAHSDAGMAPIAENPGFVYSHHANDPAGGYARNAFDLVRLHRFHELDRDAKPATPLNRLPSYIAMLRLAGQDERVKRLLAEETLDEFPDDLRKEFGDSAQWVNEISRGKNGLVEDTVQNFELISKNDPVFQRIILNARGMTIELLPGSYPWREVTAQDTPLDDYDFSSIYLHLQRVYGLKVTDNRLRHILRDISQDRKHDFVREYLESLEWDGVPRVEFALPGVKDSPHTRLVARKSLVAAVARTFEPGVKWDNMLLIYGAEGIGKSWWMERMSKGWYNSLDDITNKDALMKISKSWIVIADEGHALRVADFNRLKEFLTQRKDEFRAPFAATVTSYPRRSVVWGTTNDPAFLRRQDGNRRFLIVHAEEKVDFDAMTDEYIDQVWAEAVHLYNEGEKLYFDEEESKLLNREREPYIQEDPLVGLIRSYMSLAVPENWNQMSMGERMEWRMNVELNFTPAGSEPINEICALQVWCEVLGRRIGDHTPRDIANIHRVLRQIDGWTLSPQPMSSAAYGSQATFIRVEEPELI